MPAQNALRPLPCLISLLCSLSIALPAQAVETLPLKLNPGWNLIGLPDALSAQDLLQLNPALNAVYVLQDGALVNAATSNVRLNRGSGVALHSTAPITLPLPLPQPDKSLSPQESDRLDIPAGISAQALPVNVTLSPRLFGDRVVLTWENNGWAAYPNAAAEQKGFGQLPPVHRLQAGQGFLVIGDSPLQGSLSELASQLQPFKTEKEMTAWLREQALFGFSVKIVSPNAPTTLTTTQPEDDPTQECTARLLYPLTTTAVNVSPLPPATVPTVTNTTQTNVQVAGVDESDILKHNGREVFYTAKRSRRVLVSSFDAISRNAKPLGEIPLGRCVSIEAMYLGKDRLALVHGAGGNYWGNWFSSGYSFWNQPSTLEIFDISNPLQAKKIAAQKLDGVVVNSRLQDNRLHLLMRYVPTLEVQYPTIKMDCNPSRPGTCSYDALDYSKPNIVGEQLVPRITDLLTQRSTPLFQPERFYAPARLSQGGSDTISVLVFDASSGTLLDKVAVFGRQDTAYMSTRNLYLVNTEYPRFFGWQPGENSETRSKINRFSVAGGLDYTGSAFVSGTLLNQFSLDETADGILRVASNAVSFTTNWTPITDNLITTLGGDKNAFKPIGKLTGLGKPGESIRSARFIGNKGYLVTFRNTDPFYTLDLSNPAQPKKVGELSIPGFSSYLHPIDEQRILAIGRDASDTGITRGVQLQLFDISDFSAPKLADKRIYGSDSNTRSSAETEPKAFTYRPDGLLAFDLQTQDCVNSPTLYSCTLHTALKLLKVDGMRFKELTDIKGLDVNSNYYVGGVEYRGLLFDLNAKPWAGFLRGEEWTAAAIQP